MNISPTVLNILNFLISSDAFEFHSPLSVNSICVILFFTTDFSETLGNDQALFPMKKS